MRCLEKGVTTIVTTLLIVAAMSATATAQSPAPATDVPAAPEPVYAAGDGAEVYSDPDWCDLFTEGGFLMPIDICVAQVSLLLGDSQARSIPQALVPEDPTPPGKAVTKKGKNHFETKAFWLATGTYKADVRHKRCAGQPSGWLFPVGQQELVLPRSLSDGSYVHDLEGGKYTLEVFGLPKDYRGRPCTWRITLTPTVD